jgi:hypothetical protein
VSDRTGKGVVMIEAFNIMQDRLTRTAGDPPDVHITPHIGHIGWLDFHRAEEAIIFVWCSQNRWNVVGRCAILSERIEMRLFFPRDVGGE